MTVWWSFYALHTTSFEFHIVHSVHCISVVTIRTNERTAPSFSTVTQYNTLATTHVWPNCHMIREHKIVWKNVVYNCVLLDDGPTRPETCASWCVVILRF
jgi:hypothetical protein